MPNSIEPHSQPASRMYLITPPQDDSLHTFGSPAESYDHAFSKSSLSRFNQTIFDAAITLSESESFLDSGFFIYGPPKSGKTHLLHCISNALVNHAESALYTDERTLFQEIQHKEKDSHFTGDDALMDYKKIPVLLLDGFSSTFCPFPSKYIDSAFNDVPFARVKRLSILSEILNYRRRKSLLTFIASEWYFDSYSFDCFADNCHQIRLTSFDSSFWYFIGTCYTTKSLREYDHQTL